MFRSAHTMRLNTAFVHTGRRFATGASALCLIILPFVSGQTLGQENTLVRTLSEQPDSKSFNVYQVNSLSPLIDLGLQMQEQNRHEEAIDYFKQARQVSRIQNGLYDETQLALVEAIIESEMELENWEAVDNHYQHAEHLYHKLYDLKDPRLEEGLGKVSRWLSFSLSARDSGDRIDKLFRAKRIYTLRLQIAEQTLAKDHPKLAYLQENINICDKQLYPIPSYINDDSRRIRDDDSRRILEERNRVPLVASLER